MFGLPPWLVILIVVLAWMLFFAWLLLTLGRIGGWRLLAEKYPLEKAIIEGERWRWQSVRLRRFVSYNMIVKVTAGGEGVLLQMPLFFRAGHRPIFLPWGELSAERNGRSVIMRAAGAPEVPIHISMKLAERLKKAAGEAWRENEAIAEE